MSAIYAHYRFGAAMLEQMPADVCRTAKRQRRMYDAGLQGPDLFFFYRPVFSTKVGRLGSRFHRQTGREFFSRLCRSLRLDPTEEGQAYLYGALCHYVLDSRSHPLVEKLSWEGIASHSRLEAEFDRYLLEKDGKDPPWGMKLTKHLHLTDRECGIVSGFYPGTDGRIIRESLQSMVKIRKAMEMPKGPARSAVIKTVSMASETFRDMVVTPEPDPVCRQWNAPLMEAYQQAEKQFPEMLLQLGAHLTYNAPLGEKFNPIFG